MSKYGYLRPFANTPRQLEYIDAVERLGSFKQAAVQFGHYDHKTIANAFKSMRKRASLQGVSPEHDMTHGAPETHYVKGTSTLYDDEGNVKQQWVKTDIKADQVLQIITEACEALKEELPHYPPISPPEHTNNQLANCYVITDYHFGMLSWHEETGADWDLAIAEQTLMDWFASAVKAAPNAEVGIFAQLGDFLHYDSMAAITPTSGHLLDTDSRFQKLVRVAIRAIRAVIDMLLKKHKSVHVIMATGNHDLASSVWLREMIAHVYDQEARLTVDISPDVYYAYKWGDTSLFFHHGHKRKLNNVSSVFAAKFRDIYGSTTHSYAHMGHLHHIEVKEDGLMVAEQHRTLAAPDAYASSGGYLSDRSASVITYHKQFGEVARIAITPEMIKEGGGQTDA